MIESRSNSDLFLPLKRNQFVGVLHIMQVKCFHLLVFYDLYCNCISTCKLRVALQILALSLSVTFYVYSSIMFVVDTFSSNM